MLPIETKRAMLAGLDHETIVTGAYTHDGGICPMLAAHRRGGRTDRESFARAWDRYTGAGRGRRATEREIRTLRTMLEASLLEPFDIHALAPPIRRPIPEGWSWSRLFRRWDTYAVFVEQQGADDHIASPGRMNWISGTMHAGEVDSRNRTAAAMSSG
jgi:hypothetical protein